MPIGIAFDARRQILEDRSVGISTTPQINAEANTGSEQINPNSLQNTVTENSANNFQSVNLFDNSALLRERLAAVYQGLPSPNGLSAEEANVDPQGDERPVFITQYYTEHFNPNGNPRGGNNCGPASAAMALDAVGLQLDGTVQETIQAMRDESRVAEDKTMGLNNIQTAVQSVEGASAERGNGWEEMDAALAAGNAIVLGGDISPEWVDNFGNYSSDQSGGHFVAVLGIGANENGETVYTVADPLSPDGAVEMTREELAEFCGEVNSEGVMTGYDSDGDGDPVDFLVISNTNNAAQ